MWYGDMAGERKDYGRKNAACRVARCSALRCRLQHAAITDAAHCILSQAVVQIVGAWDRPPFPSAFRFSSHLSLHLLSSLSISSPILFRFFFHSFPFLLPFLSFSSPIAFRPSLSCASAFIVLYGKALPAMVPCRALLYCSSRRRTCALWDGLMSCVGRGAQYWNV